jgi:hypothetical protein
MELLPFAQRMEQEALTFVRHLSMRGESLAGTIRITCPESTFLDCCNQYSSASNLTIPACGSSLW